MNIEISKAALDFLPKGSYDMESIFEMRLIRNVEPQGEKPAPTYVFSDTDGSIVFKSSGSRYTIQEKTEGTDGLIRRFADFCKRHHVAAKTIGF